MTLNGISLIGSVEFTILFNFRVSGMLSQTRGPPKVYTWLPVDSNPAIVDIPAPKLCPVNITESQSEMNLFYR